MSEQQYGEEYEKDEEKVEKEHEKDEKTWDEKWRRDPLSATVWAAILIWAGLVLLAKNLGVLARFEGLDAWGIILAGAGLIVLLEVTLRLLVPSYRRPVVGSFIVAVFLVGAGLSVLLNTNLVWALILIAIGVVVLFRGLLRGR